MKSAERLEPIPLSRGGRIDAFRTRVFPSLVFAAVFVGVIFIWREVGPGGVPGIGEAEQMLVSAPHSGLLVEVLVPPYQFVRGGEPLAILHPVDPRVAFDVLQAELAL